MARDKAEVIRERAAKRLRNRLANIDEQIAMYQRLRNEAISEYEVIAGEPYVEGTIEATTG